MAIIITRSAIRAVFVNVAVLFVILLVFEWYFFGIANLGEQNQLFYSWPYYVNDPILGKVPKKGTVGWSKRTNNDTVVFDVNYSIGSNGLRISPPVNKSCQRGCVLFFGCSFTFGEGLNDNQTMPYRVGVRTQGEYRTYNFGFHGYGPHQMLAALEGGFVDQAVECQPTHAIYQASSNHAARAAGLFSWGRHSPRYRLTVDGSVKREGFIDDEDVLPPIYEKLHRQLSKSNISKWIKGREWSVKDRDIDLFVSIVKNSERIIRKKYPACQFHVILWSNGREDGTYRKTLERLRLVGLKVHPVDGILPENTTNPHQYEISKYDTHPNALADDLIAKYVAEKILDHK